MHAKGQKQHIPPENQRFNSFRRFFGKTQEEISERLGITRAGVASISTGRSKLTERNIRILQKEFNLNPRWIKFGYDPMILSEKMPGIPVLKNIPVGRWLEWLYTDKTKGIENYIQVYDVKGENLFAVRVKDDSMEPSLREGDILIIDPHKKFRRGIVLVRHTWGYKIRNVTQIEKNKYFLTPLNLSYDSEEITIDEGTSFYVPIKLISIKDV